MAYSLLASGKRIRSVLLVATREIFPVSAGHDPIPAACAFELVHTYSLIHDDLPAMDNDDYRRGRPSNHKQFGEAMAILAGDALLTEAFGLVARGFRGVAEPVGARVVGELAAAAGAAGMVGGQVLDTIDTGRDVGREATEEIHRRKTGALITAAVRCGAILGGAGEDELSVLADFGDRIGLAFQVVDDILDVVGNREVLGKSIGKDEASGKNTYVKLLGLEGSRAYAASLAGDAASGVATFGDRADALRAMASFIVERSS